MIIDGGPFRAVPFYFRDSSSKADEGFLGADLKKAASHYRNFVNLNHKTVEQENDYITI
jgi:hypothetical protein